MDYHSETRREGSSVAQRTAYIGEDTTARHASSTGLADSSRKRVPYQILNMFELADGWLESFFRSNLEPTDQPTRGANTPWGRRYLNPGDDGTYDDKHAHIGGERETTQLR